MTDIEIMYDPRAHAAGSGLVLGEDHEILPDTDWILWARRFSGVNDLFVYFHKLQGTFVLAKWLYHPERDGVGIVMELEAFNAPPNWYPPTREWMRDRLRPVAEMAESTVLLIGLVDLRVIRMLLILIGRRNGPPINPQNR